MDGVLEDSKVIDEPRFKNNHLVLGGSTYNYGDTSWNWDMSGFNRNYRFIGSIDEVTIWKENFSPSLIKRLASGYSPIRNMPDTDNDGLLDEWELKYSNNLTDFNGLNNNDDNDNDGLTNLVEYGLLTTNPTLSDTDSDGLSDSKEISLNTNQP